MNMALPLPSADLVARFTRDLHAIADVGSSPIGVAVSGGPDSLALLLLAAAGMPGRVEAATVDHGLRPGSASEAAMVADLAARIGVPHAILTPGWKQPPASNLSAAARAARYDALGDWAAERRLACIVTAHHLDDQAETLVMRLGRGSGLPGLAGVRPVTNYSAPHGKTLLVRPLLGWRKAHLCDIVDACGLIAVDDPTNADDRLDRTHARRLLAETPSLDPARLAACASHLADADTALEWATDKLFEERSRQSADGSLCLSALDLPRELQRRLVLRALVLFSDERAIPGPKVETLIESLRGGRPATLAGARVRPGPPWQFELAPPRRR